MPPSKSADRTGAAGREPSAGRTEPASPVPAPPDVREGFLAVGVVLTSFGLQGDIKVEPLTDFPERYEPGESVWLGGRKRRIQRSRWQRGVVYVKLMGISTAEAVADLRGHYLEVPEQERTPLAEDEFYQSDIIGLEVETTGGESLGRVLEFLPTGGNDVLVVRGAGGDVLIPMIADVVQQVDLPGGRLVVEPIEGLLPERVVGPRPGRPPPPRRAGRRPRRTRPRPPGSPPAG